MGPFTEIPPREQRAQFCPLSDRDEDDSLSCPSRLPDSSGGRKLRTGVMPRKAEVVMVTRRNADLPRAPDRGPPRSAENALGSASTSAARLSVGVSTETRELMIEQAAYMLAEARGFSPGRELEDWLAAESQVDAVLAAKQGAPSN